MKRKKRGAKLAYVGRHRARRRKGRRPDGPIPLDPRAGRASDPAPGEAAKTAAPGEDRAPWFDASTPRSEPLYRTIPLHDDAPGGADAVEGDAGASAATNWLGLEYSPAAPAHEPPPAIPAADRPATRGPLETLDDVVHNFVASLDQETFHGHGGGASSAHAERFLRLLEPSPATNGRVLGPPVLLGASPAMGLESVLGLLGSLRKTGILRVQAGGVLFMVSIVRGDVVHGVSGPRPESELLGNLLVARGTIDAEGLRRFFAACGSSASRIGEALNRQALVSTEELKAALEHQLQLLFDRLLATRESVWCFHEGEATLAYINMRMCVISVLLESARKSDERPAG